MNKRKHLPERSLYRHKFLLAWKTELKWLKRGKTYLLHVLLVVQNSTLPKEVSKIIQIITRVIKGCKMCIFDASEWEVFVSEQAFWNRLSGIERDVALKEGKRRGWFTYTDLDNLVDSVDLAKLAQAVITVSAICLTSYTASVLTLIGSAFIVSQVPGSSLHQPLTPLPPPLLSNDSPTSTDLPQSHHQVPLIDTLDAKFILSALCSCTNNSNTGMSNCIIPPDKTCQTNSCTNNSNTGTSNCITSTDKTRQTNSIKGWTDSSDWITNFASSTWNWLNHQLFHRSTFDRKILGRTFYKNIQLEKLAMSQNFQLSFSLNKSWIWEADNFWKDVKVWLLANRNERKIDFFSLPITSHY